jgi:hypothetical protein
MTWKDVENKNKKNLFENITIITIKLTSDIDLIFDDLRNKS